MNGPIGISRTTSVDAGATGKLSQDVTMRQVRLQPVGNFTTNGELHDVRFAAPDGSVAGVCGVGCQTAEKRRTDNQDVVLIKDVSRNVLAVVVIDGVGGHEGGAQAAQVSRDYFNNALRSAADFEHVAMSAGRQVSEALKSVGAKKSASAVYVAAVVNRITGETKIAHQGDSKIACLRASGKLELLTQDHTVGEDVRRLGVNVEIAPHLRDRVTRVLSTDWDQSVPDIKVTKLEEGEILICASDGWWNVFDREATEAFLAPIRHLAPEEIVSRMIQELDSRIGAPGADETNDNRGIVVFKQGSCSGKVSAPVVTADPESVLDAPFQGGIMPPANLEQVDRTAVTATDAEPRQVRSSRFGGFFSGLGALASKVVEKSRAIIGRVGEVSANVFHRVTGIGLDPEVRSLRNSLSDELTKLKNLAAHFKRAERPFESRSDEPDDKMVNVSSGLEKQIRRIELQVLTWKKGKLSREATCEGLEKLLGMTNDLKVSYRLLLKAQNICFEARKDSGRGNFECGFTRRLYCEAAFAITSHRLKTESDFISLRQLASLVTSQVSRGRAIDDHFAKGLKLEFPEYDGEVSDVYVRLKNDLRRTFKSDVRGLGLEMWHQRGTRVRALLQSLRGRGGLRSEI